MYQEQQKEEQTEAETYTVSRPDECGVCVSVYDEVNRRPRTLPCGHTYCSLCVCLLPVDGCLTCPACRTDHCADTYHFPISYALEAMLRAVRVQHHESASQARGETCSGTVMPKEYQAVSMETKSRGGTSLGKKMRLMMQEHQTYMERLQNTVREEMEQLINYRTKLAELQTKHNDVLKERKALVKQHQSIIKLLVEEKVKVEYLVWEGEGVETELKSSCDKLAQVIEANNNLTCIDESDRTVREVEKWLQQSKEDIPNGPMLSSSFTMLTTTKTLLDFISNEATVQGISGHSDCTIMEAVNRIEEDRTQLIELQDLRTERLKKRLEDGRVFAVQENEDGTCNSSQLKSKDNRLYMSAMKSESPPPPWSFTIHVDKVVPSFPCHVFLDFVWPGTDLRRVVIRLSPDTPGGRQFVLMCTGQRTHSYRDTNLFNVCNEGMDREYVVGGNYDGRGGTGLLADLRSDQYRKGDGAGDVFSWDYKSTRFVITTRNGKFANVFGKVIEGLNVVRAAAKYRPIEEVKVADCGVVCCGDSN